MTYQAGSASVSITPDFKDFHSQIRSELDGLDAQFAEAGDKSGKSFSDAFQSQMAASFANLPDANVKANADTAEATAKLDELTKKPRTVTIKAVLDKTASKTGTLKDLLNPVAGGIAGGIALGPQAVGLAAGVAGLGASFAAAGAAAGAFGIVAKGMFSDVEAAQKKLTSAQDAYNKATTDKGRAKALADEKAALAGLSPAEKDLATQLTALSSAWSKLQKAEQPVVGAALTPWLQTATSGMKLLSPLIEDGAGAVQLLGTEAKTALADPFWGTFFNTLGTVGQISLVNFGEAIGKVADGVAHLFVTFAPDISQLPPLVNSLATSFDNWSKSVTSKGLDDFLTKTFSPANVKALAQDGKDLASFVENVAKASQDMSPLAFAGLGNVLTILGSLSPGEIELLTGLFLAIKGIGTISKGVSAIAGIVGGIKGLLGGGATAAETAAEGTTAGTEAGTSAATAFTSTFSAEVAAALPEVFATIGAEGGTEAATAGTAMGTAAATAFGTSFGTESAAALTTAFAAEDLAGAAEATAAGAALGTALATGFGGSLTAIGTAVTAAIPEAGLVAVLAAGVAGAALGTAFGLGFTLAFSATGAKSVVSSLETDLKNSASSANTWLQPAGQQTVQGYVAGFTGQQAGVVALGAQLKGWVQQGAAGSGTWLQPHGQQAGTGFDSGFEGARGQINGKIAQLKDWVSGALPSPASWLVNTGINVGQGFINGIISMSGPIISAAQGIANSVMNTINSALQVRSPSRLTFATGVFTGQGLALGIGSTEDMVRQSGLSLAAASVQGLAGIAAGQSLAALSSLGVPSIGAAPRLPGVSSPLRGAPLQLTAVWTGANDQVTNAIVSGLQFHIQGQYGGDAQAALGQGPVRIP